MTDATDDDVVIDGPALVERLQSAGIIVERADDLELTDDFKIALHGRMDELGDAETLRDVVAEKFDIDPDDLAFSERDDKQFEVHRDDVKLGTWSSKSTLVADLSLDQLLQEWFALWERLDGFSRGELLSRLRGFLEECPICDGHLEMIEDAEDPEDGTDVTLVCTDCDRPVFDGTFF